MATCLEMTLLRRFTRAATSVSSESKDALFVRMSAKSRSTPLARSATKFACATIRVRSKSKVTRRITFRESRADPRGGKTNSRTCSYLYTRWACRLSLFSSRSGIEESRAKDWRFAFHRLSWIINALRAAMLDPRNWISKEQAAT